MFPILGHMLCASLLCCVFLWQNRALGATNCNERSSRSHSVFTLNICGHNSSTQQDTYGVLNLIDLAGSERLHASGAVGDRCFPGASLICMTFEVVLICMSMVSMVAEDGSQMRRPFLF